MSSFRWDAVVGSKRRILISFLAVVTVVALEEVLFSEHGFGWGSGGIFEINLRPRSGNLFGSSGFSELPSDGIDHTIVSSHSDLHNDSEQISNGASKKNWTAQSLEVREQSTSSSPLLHPPISTTFPMIRFVLYDYRFGQFNNQMAALLVALTTVRLYTPNATLVLPPVTLGRESRAQFNGSTPNEVDPVLHIVGDLLDSAELSKVASVIQYDAFRKTEAGKQAQLARQCVWDGSEEPRNENSPITVHKETYGLDAAEPLNWDDNDSQLNSRCLRFRDSYINAAMTCSELPSILLLPKTFGAMDRLCILEYPEMKVFIKHLIPRKELRRSIEEFFEKLPGPVLGIHLRILNNASRACMHQKFKTPDRMISFFVSEFRSRFKLARSIFIAFDPSDPDLQKFHAATVKAFSDTKRIVTCADIPNCGATRSPWAREQSDVEFSSIFRTPYSFALMDMWALARSDFFIGTRFSTFSVSVARWRLAFEDPLEKTSPNQNTVMIDDFIESHCP